MAWGTSVARHIIPRHRARSSVGIKPSRTGSLLENDYLPGDLENRIAEFVDHYNNHRYHESLNNVTPADAYFGRDTAIIERRAKIKKRTIQKRRLFHQQHAA